MFGVDPDNGSGALEVVISVGLLCVAAVSFYLPRREYVRPRVRWRIELALARYRLSHRRAERAETRICLANGAAPFASYRWRASSPCIASLIGVAEHAVHLAIADIHVGLLEHPVGGSENAYGLRPRTMASSPRPTGPGLSLVRTASRPE